MPATANLQPAVEAEIARYGSLDAAISGLSHDACGAPWGARVHEVLTAALAEQSRLREAAKREAA